MKQLPRPLGDRVLVRQEQPKNMIGSFFIPDTVGKDYPPFGLILATGPHVSVDCPLAGTRVLFKRRPASALALDDREPDQEDWLGLLMLREEDILGVVE